MVFLVDELEQRGLVEHRRNTADRRSYALYLTAQGRDKLREVQASGSRHQDQIGASLTQAERIQLTTLLRRLAAEQGNHRAEPAENPATAALTEPRPGRALISTIVDSVTVARSVAGVMSMDIRARADTCP